MKARLIKHGVGIAFITVLLFVSWLSSGCAYNTNKAREWDAERNLVKDTRTRSLAWFSGKVKQETTAAGVKSSINREGLSDNGAAAIGKALEAVGVALQATP